MADRFEIVFNIIEQEMAKPYKAGKADCFFMALRVVDALKKSKLTKEATGAYTSIESSKREMVKRGYKTISDALEPFLISKPAASLVLGDIAVIMRNETEHVAVCVGQQFIVKGENGREIYSLTDVIAGFEV